LPAFFIGDADDGMVEAAVRLARALHAPERSRVLGPWIVRELFYFLLKGPEGPSIRQFVRAGSAMHRIANAVFTIRTNLQNRRALVVQSWIRQRIAIQPGIRPDVRRIATTRHIED
jgi:hypothetical protein